jgi:hypothetical protein
MISAADIPLSDPELHGARWRQPNLPVTPIELRREILAVERAAAANRLARLAPARDETATAREVAELRRRLDRFEEVFGLDGDALVEALGQILPRFVDQRTKHLEQRIRELEARQQLIHQGEPAHDLERRVAVLERRPPGLDYKGVWKNENAAFYAKNDMVTDRGAMWIAVAIPTARPGDGESGWQLAAKAATPPRKPVVA